MKELSGSNFQLKISVKSVHKSIKTYTTKSAINIRTVAIKRKWKESVKEGK